MNGKSFFVAMALVMALAVVVAGRDGGDADRPAGANPDKLPTWRHPVPGRPPGPRRQISPERVEALLKKMKAREPEIYEHLKTLRKENPRAFAQAVMKVDRVHRRMDELPPEIRKMLAGQRKNRMARYGLVKRYRSATDEDARAALAGKIRDVTARIFDADQKFKEFKLQQMTRELEQLKKELQDRAARRDELIGRTVKRLLATPRSPAPNATPAG